nr:immunoglobulin heavy chain junction region [Macaca mulatta]
CARTSNGFDYW